MARAYGFGWPPRCAPGHLGLTTSRAPVRPAARLFSIRGRGITTARFLSSLKRSSLSGRAAACWTATNAPILASGSLILAPPRQAFGCGSAALWGRPSPYVACLCPVAEQAQATKNDPGFARASRLRHVATPAW